MMHGRTARRCAWTAAAVLFFGGLASPALVETLRGRGREEWKDYTPPITPVEAADLVARGRKVVFVDVREAAEHEELRIPGSVHVTLPDLHSADLRQLEGAEAVIPYCMKDFRGWEGAKILVERGVKNVKLLEGFGSKSWEKKGLPLAGRKTLTTDEEALRMIRARFEGVRP